MKNRYSRSLQKFEMDLLQLQTQFQNDLRVLQAGEGKKALEEGDRVRSEVSRL